MRSCSGCGAICCGSCRNLKHEVLARERAAGATQAKAWELAGFDPKSKNASRTFSRQNIQDRIEFLRVEFNRMAGINLAAIQARLLRLADADPLAVVEQVELDKKRGEKKRGLVLRDLAALGPEERAAISELRIEDDGAVTVKTTNAEVRLGATNALLKTIGVADRHEFSGPGGGPIETKAISDHDRARALAAFVAKVTIGAKAKS